MVRKQGFGRRKSPVCDVDMLREVMNNLLEGPR
jgi:hypothetical protein